MAAGFRAIALLHLLPRLLVASTGPDAACDAGEAAEEAALLQSSSRRGDAWLIPAVPPSLLSGAAPAPGSAGPYPVKCYANQSIQCPGSSNQCAGNQCCPGILWSGGKTFPCPSATSVEASNCASSTKAWYCAASSALQSDSARSIPAVPPSLLSGAAPAPGSAGPYPVKCYANQSIQCPGSSNQCAGNQCCPGILWSGGKTFPCPSATSVEASNCASSTKAWYCAR